MTNLLPQHAQLLYDKIQETLRQEGLSERERIPAYRRTLEELYRALSADEKRYFGSLSARMSYVHSELKTPRDIQEAVKHLRVFANSVVHESDFTATAADDARCLYALCTAIQHFSGENAPDFLRASWEHFQDGFAEALRPKRKPRPSYRIRAVVHDIFVPEHIHSKAHCVLTCETDELGTINIKFWDNRREDGSGADLSAVHEFLQPYNTIYITDIKAYEGREGEYYATDNSLIVLEPDYLLEAKEVAECCQYEGDNPLLHLLGRFTKGEVTESMMLGNLAGQMLDDIATSKKYDYTACFDRMMRDNSFSMLCMAHQEGTYRREIIKKVYEDGKALERTLRYALENFKGKQLSLEPTFISAQYGLQGRLDALLEDPREPLRKDVVEMKSGNFHTHALYPNHEAQALIYSLLLESTFTGRKGHSAILYAKAAPEQSPLRDVRDDHPARKQALLLLRNRIVANELRLASGDMSPLDHIRPEQFGPVPKYKDRDVAAFYQTLQAASPLLRDWFLEYTRFIFREMQTGKTGNPDNPDDAGGFATLWRSSKAEKVSSFNALTDLRLLNVSDDFKINLQINNNLFSTSVTGFRDGETAILYPTPDSENLQPLAQQILKCTIVRLGTNEVVVSLANKQIDQSYFKQHSFWAIERDFRETGYKTMLSLLFRFLQAPTDTQNRLLGLLQPRFPNAPTAQQPNSPSNSPTAQQPNSPYNSPSNSPTAQQPNSPSNSPTAQQTSLVSRALSARDYFLIQGPPGTGKTSTVLKELVRRMYEEELNVMVIAFTNQAVNVICDKLQGLGIEFIKLGRGDAPHTWQSLSASLKLNELYEKAARTRVFVSTQAGFANSLDLLKFKKFHTLIVDEASQLLEPQLAGILHEFERFIMIGDDNQLPAVVLQDDTVSRSRSPLLAEIGLHNLRDSLFTRLLNNARARGWDDCYGMLSWHYRMHADIADYPNRHFYGGLLQPALPEQQAPVAWPHSEHPLHRHFQQRVSFIPTRPDVRSKINDEEAVLVTNLIRYVHQLYGDRFDPNTTVGVITPFRAQIANIRQKLPAEYQSVTIDTVERFQGSERDVIIVSLAVKSPLQLRAIQSVNEAGVDRKLNVAITRAKEHLVMMGVREVVGGIIDLYSPKIPASNEHLVTNPT